MSTDFFDFSDSAIRHRPDDDDLLGEVCSGKFPDARSKPVDPHHLAKVSASFAGVTGAV